MENYAAAWVDTWGDPEGLSALVWMPRKVPAHPGVWGQRGLAVHSLRRGGPSFRPPLRPRVTPQRGPRGPYLGKGSHLQRAASGAGGSVISSSAPCAPRTAGGCRAPPASTAMAAPRGSHRCSAGEGLIQTRSSLPAPPGANLTAPPRVGVPPSSPGCKPSCTLGSENLPPAPRDANLPPLLRAIPPPPQRATPSRSRVQSLHPGTPWKHQLPPRQPHFAGTGQAGGRPYPAGEGFPPSPRPPALRHPPCTGAAGRLLRPDTAPFHPPRTG